MNIRDYTEKIKEILESEFYKKEDKWKIDYCETTKNNNVIYHGLVISDEKNRVAPNIYVDGYFKDEIDPVIAAIQIEKTFEAHKKEMHNLPLKGLDNFEEIKDKICYKVINAERNMNILQRMPSIPVIEDLRGIFYIRLNDEMSINITNDVVDMWKINKEDATVVLFDLARNNTEQLKPVSYQSLYETISELMGKTPFDAEPKETQGCFVLTTKDGVYGATAMLYQNGKYLNELLNKMNCKGIYILPSSIHELLVIRDGGSIKEQELMQMVYEVNRSAVTPEERLSDNIYYFDNQKGLRTIGSFEHQFEIGR